MMRMHTKMFLLGLGLLALASAVRGAEPEVVEMQMPGEPGQRRLVISLLSGTLNITGTDGDQLRIETTRSDSDQIASKDAETDPRAQGLAKLTGGATGLFVRDRDGIAEVEIGSQLLQDEAGGVVSMDIQLPRDVELDISSQYADAVYVDGMSGAVTVRATEADVTVNSATGALEIQTVRGWIRLYDITGPVEANTSFGGIEGTLSKLSPDKPIWLTAAVGPVDVALPAEADATMTLGSTWGEIYSDFDMTLDRAPDKAGKAQPAPPAVPSIPKGANAIDPENVVVHGSKEYVPAPAAAPEPAPAPRVKRGRTEADAAEAAEEEVEVPAEGASVVGKVPKAEKKSVASVYSPAVTLAPPAPPRIKRYVGRIGTGRTDIRIQTGSKNIYIRRTDEKKKK